MRLFVARHGAVFALILVLGLVYVPWNWGDQLASLGGDSAVYVMSARDFAPYVPADPVAHAAAADSVFPPLYPAVLALLGGAADLRIAHAITTLELLAAFAALYAFALSAGLPRTLAMAATLLFSLEPGTWLQAFHLHSENQYSAVSLAALAALLGGSQTRRPAAFWAAAMWIGAAILTRSAGVALLPAFAIAVLRARPRGGLLMLAASVAPALLWSLVHRPEHDYTHSFLDRYEGLSLTALAERLLGQVGNLGEGLVANFAQLTAPAWVLAPLAGCAAFVALQRFFKGQPDAWYFFAYAAMLVVWPYPAEAMRLVWVITPLLLVYASIAALQIGAHLPAGSAWVRTAARWAIPAVLLLVLAPDFDLAMQRRFHPATAKFPGIAQLPEWYRADPQEALLVARAHLDLVEVIRELNARVPPGECVYAIKPVLVAFYSGRGSRAPPWPAVGDAEFQRSIQSSDCRYFLLLGVNGLAFPEPFYPAHRLDRNRLDVVGSWNSKVDGSALAVLAHLRS